MLRSLKELKDYTVMDLGNEVIGQVYDFYFDDVSWAVRYLVVDSGTWLPGEKVLISSAALGQPDWGGGVSLPVRLTKQQIEESPSTEADEPPSRHQEVKLAHHFGWPAYWKDVTVSDAQAAGIGTEAYLEMMREAESEEQAEMTALEEPVTGEDIPRPHLRRAAEVTGYYIHATDGDIGHIEDFIVDTQDWVIRYAVVDTRNWLPGRKVLVASMWIEAIDSDESEVYVDLPRDLIKKSPEFDPSDPINRDYEAHLFDYYGRPKYWSR